MNTYINEIKATIKDTIQTTGMLLKIMIPVSIIVKILDIIGLIEVFGQYLSPIMRFVGLPGEYGIVWATAMITNIYGGIIVFITIASDNIVSVAQVTILCSMILIAHSLPIEVSIAKKAGVKIWFTLVLRILSAICFGSVLFLIFSQFSMIQSNAVMTWQPEPANASLQTWGINQLKNYVMIFVIIFILLLLMKILNKTGIIGKINNIFEPGLEKLGMSKDAAPITIIGTTLGITYGGGLIIKEIKSGKIKAKDAFLSVSLMGLTHSLIEDTLLMLTLGASLIGILVGRVIFTLIFMVIFIRLISILSEKTFKKYFYNI
jgi:hypothetical protein